VDTRNDARVEMLCQFDDGFHGSLAVYRMHACGRFGCLPNPLVYLPLSEGLRRKPRMLRLWLAPVQTVE
jgi:hypothetical protein